MARSLFSFKRIGRGREASRRGYSDLNVRHRHLVCEALEARRMLSIGGTGLGDAVSMDPSDPAPEIVYYDYVEDGILKGGRAEVYPTAGSPSAGSSVPPPAPWNVTTVINNGPTSNRIDLVTVGDGYTEAELGSYTAHVDNVLAPFFSESPLDAYSTFFNVHRVDVISNESGVDNDPTLGIERDTALDMGFWTAGIERLLGVDVGKAQAAAAQAPDVDQVLALANSTKYGGAGYPDSDVGTVSGGNFASREIAIHEFGHSFADLADEYDYDDSSIYIGPEPADANVSTYDASTMASLATKWHLWLSEPDVDTFEGAMYHEFGIYRPTFNSKMRSNGQPFGPVNTEQLVISGYKTVQPIDYATPPGTHPASTVFFVDPVDPTTHALDVQWYLDGSPILGATETTLDASTLGLFPGSYTLGAEVVDNTSFVRDEVLRALWMTEERTWTLLVQAGDIRDFGDAPAPYPTTLAENGAVHMAVGPALGSNRDAEADGQPSANADGDDIAGTIDDEDGVTFTSALVGGQAATVDLTASDAGLLNAWIDFNNDGDWEDAGEQVFTDAALVTGVNSLSFPVPVTPPGETYARFRFSTVGGLSYDGLASDGEVEDHRFSLGILPDAYGLFQGEHFPTGLNQNSVAAADFNGDTFPDLVTTNGMDDNISVLLGLGDGRFAPQVTYEVGRSPWGVAVADLNGDDLVDIVTTNWETDDVSVLLGLGDGTFATQVTYDVGWHPRALALSDVNSDSHVDMVVTNGADNNVSVHLGIGDGTFASPVTYDVGRRPRSVALADLNGDGDLDIVAANRPDDNVSVLLGFGDGTFAAQVTYAVEEEPYSVAVADLNGDNHLDIVTSSYLYGNVSVLLGIGDGTFAAQVTYDVGNGPLWVALSDLSGDGHVDIISGYDKNKVAVLLGLGDGTFHTQVSYVAGNNPSCVVPVDVNGDSHVDIVTANAGDQSVSVLLGYGDGTFPLQTTHAVGDSPQALARADLNGDSHLDVVAVNRDDHNVSVLLGIGDGTFDAQVTYPVGMNPSSVALADLNDDNHVDIVTANPVSNDVSVLLGVGDGTFAAQVTYPATDIPVCVALADLNGDSHVDIVAANINNNDVSVLLGLGDGTFTAQVSYSVGFAPLWVALADLDGDNHVDIVTANETDDNVSVLLGLGDGTFATQVTYLVGDQPDCVALVDLNDDSHVDIVTANAGPADNNVSVLLGLGDGTFATQAIYNVGWHPRSLVPGDVNDDGHVDLVAVNYGPDNVSVLAGLGDGTFATHVVYPAGTAPYALALGDFNSDGYIDLVTTNMANNNVSVTLNQGPAEELDFGDAPTAAQSGFAANYPTTLADNGARHAAIGPTLGTYRDTEADGQLATWPLDNSLQVVDLRDLTGDLPLDVVSSTQILWQTQDWEHNSYQNPAWPLGGADTVGYPTMVRNDHGLNPDGKYYLYYAHHDPMSGIGCAVADSITGPYAKISPTDSMVLTVPNYNPAGPNPDDPSHYSTPSVVWNKDEQLWFMYFHYYNHLHGAWDADPSRPGQGYQMTALATTPDLSSHDWSIYTDASYSGVSAWDIVPVLHTTDEDWANESTSYDYICRLKDGTWLAFMRGTTSDTADGTITEVGFATSTDGRNWNYLAENPVIQSGKPWTTASSEYRPKFIAYLGEDAAGDNEYLVAWGEHSDPNTIYSTTTDFITFERDPRGYADWGVGEDGIVSAWREGDDLYLFTGKYVLEMLLPVADPLSTVAAGSDSALVPEPFIMMYGHYDGAGVTEAFREIIPPFSVIEGTSEDATFILELRNDGKEYAAHVTNPASETAAELLARWRAPFDNDLGGQLPGGYDAIAIDELHGSDTNGTAHSDAVASALQQLRALYPNKSIYAAATWQYGADAASYTDQLNAVNDYADMLVVENYLREGHPAYGDFASWADNLKAAVPGILAKSVYGLYIAQGGFVADDTTDVGYWGHLDEQFHSIRTDADASTMPGVMFWVYYRSERDLTPDYVAKLVDHYYIQHNTGYFSDGDTDQLITNPQFETLTDWTLTTGTGGSVRQFSYASVPSLENDHDDHAQASHASYGLEMVRGSTPNEARFSVSGLDTSMVYTVSAWVIADSVDEQAKLTITESDGTHIESMVVDRVGSPPDWETKWNEWSRIAFHFVPTADTIKIVLSDEPTTLGTTLYWDFIELEEAFPNPPVPDPPTGLAIGDDITGTPNDEDGVTFESSTLWASTTTVNTTASVEIDLQNADASSNRLDAWIDFNQDGDWNDSGEQIFTNYDLGTSDGVQTLTFTVPQDMGPNVELGDTYARVRLSTAGGLLPTGAAADGEVEDYQVELVLSTALDRYVSAFDASYGYTFGTTLSGPGYTAYVLDMTSQTWRTALEVDKPVWQHWVTAVVPDGATSNTAILFVDGGSNGKPMPTSVNSDLLSLALGSGLITIHLPTVPSEPLIFSEEGFERTEDEIIAYTYDKYMETGDEEYPLLLPMVKSAVAAMDTAQDFLPGQIGFGVDNFFVTGASKRGWTTWLTAAVDSRVSGIVPLVIDVLNMDESMVHHKENYQGVTEHIIGGYSDSVHDYVDLNVMDRLHTPEGQALLEIVDPYEYRDRLTLPKYIVNSAGDQFFVPDSSQFYFDDLLGPKYMRYVPNTDHGLNADAIFGAVNYMIATEAGAVFPTFDWALESDGQIIRVNTVEAPVQVSMWQATNPNSLDFRLETFGAGYTDSILTDSGGGEYVAQMTPPPTGGTAFFVELVYMVGGLPITFTTEVSILAGKINRPPLLDSIGSKSTDEQTELAFTATATDPDLPADTLTFSLDAAAEALGMSINATTGAFSWTPTESQGGTSYNATITVSDGSLTDWETISIAVAEVNVAPVLAPIGHQKIDEETELTFTATATDPDIPANGLTFSLDAGAPTGASIDPVSGLFTWTPTEAQGPGRYSITVRVTDNGTPALDDFELIAVSVGEVNRPPVLDLIGNKSVVEETELAFTATASDPDLPVNGLTFSLDVGAPAGASIDPISGLFTWTPTEDQGPGSYPIAFRVTDDGTPMLDDFELIAVTVGDENRPPVLDSIGNKSTDEQTELAFTATASDPDLPVNGLTFSLDVGAPAGASIDPVSGLFTWTPTETQGPDSYPITVRVTDDGTPNLDDFEMITVTVGEVNRPPVLDSIGNKSIDELAELSFTAIASDPDLPANGLTFSLDAGAPAGASIDPVSGLFTWTPTEAQGPGSYPIAVRVTDDGTPMLDDFETITVTVGEVNRPPVLDSIGNKSIDEQTELAFTATAGDPDLPANGLTFSLDTGAEALGMSITGGGAFSWTPTELQGEASYDATITVTDGSLSDWETISITVARVNGAPVLTPIGHQEIDEEIELTFTATATDLDLPANGLTFSLDAGAPAGASIDPISGLFTWTPTEAQGPGSYPITVRVTDDGTPMLDDFELITVTVGEVNRPPVLDSIGNKSTDEQTELAFTATATDPDLPANGLTFSLDAAAEALGMSITGGGAFSWTPTELQGGASYDATITVTDGGLSDWETISITVAKVNVAPLLTPIGHQEIDEEIELTFTATATDSDIPANGLTFSLDAGAPAGASIDPVSGLFAWTPTEAQGPGRYSITVRVTDDGTPILDDFELITVTVDEVNRPPVLDSIGNKSTDELTELAFTATASDPDLPANELAFSLDAGAPAGASIDPVSGLFTWTPTETQGPGSYPITVRVTDDGTPNLDDFEMITVTVDEVNRPPVLDSIGNKSTDEQAELAFTATASDPDLPVNGLTFSLDVGAPVGASIDPLSGLFTWTPTEAQGPGSYPITVRVTDDGTPNLDDFETITVTVGEVNRSPVLDSIGNKSTDEQTELAFTAIASDPDLPANGLAFSLDAGAPAGASIDPVSGLFTWTPTEAQGPGSYPITVRVTDDGTPMLDDFELITVTVGEVNRPPVLDSIGNKSIDEQTELSFTATATDPDLPANGLTFSLDAAAEALGMSITGGGAFSWTPTELQGDASYNATITVTDGSLSDSETTSITVVPPVVDLGTVGFQLLEHLSLAGGSLYYCVETSHDGVLTLQVDVPEPSDSARLKLYDANPVETVGLTPLAESTLDEDGNQRIDWPTLAGAMYYVEVYGINTDFDARIANLLHHNASDSVVTVYGTDDDDTFIFDSAASRAVIINGVRYLFTDEEVAAVGFDAGEGRDMVEVCDSTGDEMLEAWPNNAVFSNGPGDSIEDFVVTMAGFEELQAYARKGGTDTATLHGSAHNDKLISYEEFVRLRGVNSIYALRAKFFDSIVGDSGPGGSDTAVFKGADGNDIFRYTGADNKAQVESTGRNHSAVGFGTVIARAGGGTANVAHFTDTPVDDVFYFKSHKTQLVSAAANVTVRAFDEVHATASESGFDVARIYDTSLDDHFEFDGDTARLYRRIGTELKLLYEAIAFERVKAFRTSGDDTRDVQAHTFELFEYGWE